MKRLKKKGFTLVEMIVTILLIVTLSAVSVPIYKQHNEKAILAEGYLLLSMIREAQKAYYSEYGNFLYASNSSAGNGNYFTCNEQVLGIDARGNKYFTWFAVNGTSGYGANPNNLNHYFIAVILDKNNKDFIMQYNVTLGQNVGYKNQVYSSTWHN